MSNSYSRSDHRPTLQRRPLTAPAPIRPLLCATATTATTVLKPHPLPRRAVSYSIGPPIEDDAAAAGEEEEGGGSAADDAAAAAEELREIVANLSFQQQQGRPPDTDTTLPNQANSRSATTAAATAAVAIRRSSPSTSSSSSSSYLNRALPRTPSRGSRNGGVGVGVPLKRKASLGNGGTGSSSAAVVVRVPESDPMQVDTAGFSPAAGDDELDSELCWATHRNDKLGRRDLTPLWIGLEGKRCEFPQSPDQDYFFSSLLYHIGLKAEPVRPPALAQTTRRRAVQILPLRAP